MKSYKREEVLKSSIKYFHGDELAATTWMNKYALKQIKDDGTEIFYELNPDDMHHRLASEMARIESKYPNPMSEKEIYELLKDFKYVIPQGSPMSGIGNDFSIQSLSNCFVVGNEESDQDSYGGIFKVDQELVQLCKRRGGVGTDLSGLRPIGAKVTNAAKYSSGVASFMERYSNSIKEVSQLGRRGALMLTVSVTHPDAEGFIDAKLDTTKVTGANVSVKITDKFMDCAIKEKKFLQIYPINSNPSEVIGKKDYDLSDYTINKLYQGKKKGTYFKVIDAKKLWDKIIYNAWKSAEPGVLFWDQIIRESPADQYADLGYKTVSTNPCGELPLCTYDSCRLQCMNLYSYVDNPFTENASFNFKLFDEHVYKAQRLMDDILDLELEKIEKIIEKIKSDPESDEVKSVELNLWNKIYKKTKAGRRTGLGVTAEGDMLAALGVIYASSEAINISREVHIHLAMSSYKSSIDMAEERGKFEVCEFERDMNSPFLKRIYNLISQYHDDKWKKYGRRNIANLTLAPTGTVSLMTQTTSGIEPAFLITYKRRRKTSDKSKAVFTDRNGEMFEEYRVVHPKFIDWYKINIKDEPNDKVIEYLNTLSDDEMNDLIKESPYYKSTANDINWVDKVKMQGEIQTWIDHSISCTVNVPEQTTVDTIANVYLEAWKSGCKGVTVYRDKSRDGVLISEKQTSNQKPKERPRVLNATVLRFRNGNENWISFIGLLDGKPFEVFTGKIDEDTKYLPKKVESGKIIKIETENSHRYDFQYEIEFGYTNTLPDIGSAFNPEYYNYARMVSAMLQEGVKLEKIINVLTKLKCGDTINAWNKGVARALKKFIADGTKSGTKCEFCGAELIYVNGCTSCPGCGQGGKCD